MQSKNSNEKIKYYKGKDFSSFEEASFRKLIQDYVLEINETFLQTFCSLIKNQALQQNY